MTTTITLQHVSKTFYPSGGPPPDEDEIPTHASKPKAPGLTQAVRRLFSTAEAKPAIQPKDRTALTGPVRALDDVTLTVRAGEILGVLGPSGCGKSTLLRAVAGLVEADSGDVLYDGVPLAEIPMRERGVGMVFQDFALYPHMQSEENIGFFLRLRQREEEIPQRVQEISAMMDIGLEPLLSRKPPTLSGGERQRVAIARCLARDPRVFLFDEPFSNLDAGFRAGARVELKRLLRRYTVTSIYVTHDQTEAIALADRIAVMREGQLEQIGSFRHLYDTPKNIFVAGFLGSPAMNLFYGTIQGDHWVGPAFSWGPVRPDLPTDTSVVLGVRPEHLLLDPEGALEADVELVEPLYGQRVQLVYTLVGPHRVVARLPEVPAFHQGDHLRLAIQPGQVHLFDNTTGLRIG